MTVESVLVVGATGTQGGAVADALLEAGEHDVHALTRRPDSDAAARLADQGATVVEGNLDDRASIDSALADVDGLFGVTDYFEHGKDAEIRHGETLAEAAADADVEVFVFSSVCGADRDTGLALFESKHQIERRIHELELPATIVRPTYFMENFEAMRDPISGGTLPLALDPDVPLQLLAARDLGAVVAEVFHDPTAYAGGTVPLASDELTPAGMAVRFAEATGADVEAFRVPDEKLRETMGDAVADMFAWFDEEGFGVRPDTIREEHPVAFTSFERYLERAGW